MRLPEEAVDAAAEALWEATRHPSYDTPWAGIADNDLIAPRIRDEARAAVDAAAEALGLKEQTIEPAREIREWVGDGEVHARRLVGPWLPVDPEPKEAA
jgi:hypothetical protein